MRVTWYPRNVLLAIVLLALFAWGLRTAVDFRTGAVVGLLALLTYLAFEVGSTFNPGVWRRSHRS